MRLVDGMRWPERLFELRGKRDAVRHVRGYISKASKHLPGLVSRCDDRRCVVQAGGHCGAWPIWLAGQFDTVHTWEPHPENFTCLELNAREARTAGTIIARCALLGETPEPLALVQHDRNSGGHHARPEAGSTPVHRLDDLGLAPQAIVLDVEGMELPALRGAEQTIRRNWPVIMLEDRGHGTKYGWGEAIPWLEDLGYAVVEEAGHDKILERAL